MIIHKLTNRLDELPDAEEARDYNISGVNNPLAIGMHVSFLKE